MVISGNGGSTKEAEFTLTFQAMAEGTINIEVSQSPGVDAAGDALNLTRKRHWLCLGRNSRHGRTQIMQITMLYMH